MSTERKGRAPIGRIAAVFAAAIIVVAVVAAAFFRQSHEEAALNHWKHHERHLAEIVGAGIRREFDHGRAILQTVADSPQFRSLWYTDRIDAAINGIPEDMDRPKRDLFDRLLRQYPLFSAFCVLTPEGDHYVAQPFSIQESLRQFNVADRPFFRQAAETGKAVVSDVVFGADGQPAVIIDVPVVGADGSILSHVAGMMHLDTLSAFLFGANEGTSTVGLLTDRKGYIIAHAGSVLDGVKPKTGGRPHASDMPLFAKLPKAWLDGRSPVSVVEAPDGKRWVVASFTLDLGWHLGIAQPLAAVLGPHRDAARQATLVLLSVLLAIGGTGLAVIFWLGRLWSVAEEARLETESKYRRIVDGTAEGYWEIDPRTKLTLEVNDSLARMLGYGRSEMIGCTPFEFTDEENARIFKEQISRLHHTEHRSYDITLKRKDGRNVVTRFNATTLRDENGRPTAAYAFVTDVTAQRLQTEENRRLHERLRMILGATGEGIVGLDALGHITFVNKATERLTGWPQEELMGGQFHGILRHSRPDGVPYPDEECPVNRAFREGEEVHVEGEVLWRKDGSHFPVEYLAAPITIEGRIVGGVVAFHDISERLAAKEALAAKTVELERSNADLQQFAYVASHDLQEPLRMVTSYLQLLQRRYGEKIDTEADEFIGFAVDGARRMSALIRDLLEYSRVDTRGRELEPVDVTTLLDDVLADLSVACGEAGAVVEKPDRVPRVLGDAGQIARLFQNLIGNAVKYRAPDRPPRIRIGVEDGPGPGLWTFSISDNGIGIEPEHRERIFMIFQRLHGHGEYEGTGIGLAVCKRIVERHGGRIWVQSVEGGGSDFRFTLRGAGDGVN